MASWYVGLKRDKNAERNNDSPAVQNYRRQRESSFTLCQALPVPGFRLRRTSLLYICLLPATPSIPSILIMKTSTLVAATAGTVLTGLLGKSK